jgi:hypothetical protein
MNRKLLKSAFADKRLAALIILNEEFAVKKIHAAMQAGPKGKP